MTYIFIVSSYYIAYKIYKYIFFYDNNFDKSNIFNR